GYSTVEDPSQGFSSFGINVSLLYDHQLPIVLKQCLKDQQFHTYL
ncbi:37028_t:CDS:1, partial [Racocetra persica]